MVIAGIMVIGTLGSRGEGRICVIGLGGMVVAPRGVFRIRKGCVMVTRVLLWVAIFFGMAVVWRCRGGGG